LQHSRKRKDICKNKYETSSLFDSCSSEDESTCTKKVKTSNNSNQSSFTQRRVEKTYTNKQKCRDTAAEKFDAIFGNHETRINRVNNLSNRPSKQTLNSLADKIPSSLSSGSASCSTSQEDTECLSPSINQFDGLKPSLKTGSSTSDLPITSVTVSKVDGKIFVNIERRRSGTSSKNHMLSTDNVRKVTQPEVTSSLKLNEISSNNKNVRYGDMTKNTSPSLSTSIIDSNIKTLNGSKYNSGKKSTNVPLTKTHNGRACYNHRPWMSESEEGGSKQLLCNSKPTTKVDTKSLENSNRIIQTNTFSQRSHQHSSNKIIMQHTEIVTYVRNVKNFQNCFQEGETQEFANEVDYLIEGLTHSNHSASVKSLLIASFAGKCLNSNFLLYLKAHSILAKIFPLLSDFSTNKALSLATSALLYVISRDHQSDLDRTTLNILFRLLDPHDRKKDSLEPVTISSNVNESVKRKYGWKRQKKVQEATASTSKSSLSSLNDEDFNSVHLKVKDLIVESDNSFVKRDNFSTKTLCGDSLLKYSSRSSNPEWFREELRLQGGLDYIISIVNNQVMSVSSTNCLKLDQDDATLLNEKNKFCILGRLLKVLDKCIMDCPANTMYLVTHKRALLLDQLSTLLKICERLLITFTPNENQQTKSSNDDQANFNSILNETIKQIIKLFINLSNDNEWISNRIGEQKDLIKTIIFCIFRVPSLIAENEKYEMLVLSLSLIVNMVECSAANRLALSKIQIDASVLTSHIKLPNEKIHSRIDIIHALVMVT